MASSSLNRLVPSYQKKASSFLEFKVFFTSDRNIYFLSEQLASILIAEINVFRRIHHASDVTPSEKLNQLASQRAQKIAATGVEKTYSNSTYGQLVCTHNAGGNIAKVSTVKWYGAIKFFDWADPKLTIKASPFTQMVWKSNSAAGVAIAKGKTSTKRQNLDDQYYLVVLFDPGQDANANIKENVLPATGQLTLHSAFNCTAIQNRVRLAQVQHKFKRREMLDRLIGDRDTRADD